MAIQVGQEAPDFKLFVDLNVMTCPSSGGQFASVPTLCAVVFIGGTWGGN